jgi:hypothetical protein
VDECKPLVIGVTLLHIRELTDPKRMRVMEEDPDTGLPTTSARMSLAEPAWKEWADKVGRRSLALSNPH